MLHCPLENQIEVYQRPITYLGPEINDDDSILRRYEVSVHSTVMYDFANRTW